MGAAMLFARHQVEDYDVWRAVYDSLEGVRQQYGCAGAEVMANPADKNDVFVIQRFPTLESARAFAGSTKLKGAMGRAGLAGPPRVEIAVEA